MNVQQAIEQIITTVESLQSDRTRHEEAIRSLRDIVKVLLAGVVTLAVAVGVMGFGLFFSAILR